MVEQDRETREVILDAAHTVFMRHGTARARTHEIALEAGVNKALLHYYFGTKAALAEAVFQRAAGELFPRVFGILRSADPLDEKVRALVPTYIDFLAARPYLPGYIISELHADPNRARQIFEGRGPIALDLIREQIAERVAKGSMRPITAEQFLANLFSLLIFPFISRPILGHVLQLEGPRYAAFLDERKRTLADFFLNSLRP